MYESLIEWDAKLNSASGARPELERRRPEDGRLHAQARHRFHNGQEVTAADVKYSFERWLEPAASRARVTTVGQVPSIERPRCGASTCVRMQLKKPDARLFGFLAWTRYSAIVPEGMYQQVNAGREGIGTGPFRLTSFTPDQGTEYQAYTNYRKKGLPYLSRSRCRRCRTSRRGSRRCVPARSTGRPLSADGAKTFKGNSNLTVLQRPHGRLPRAADDA